MLILKLNTTSIKPEIDEAVIRVFESSQFVLGAEVVAFEKEIRLLLRCRKCHGCEQRKHPHCIWRCWQPVLAPGDEVHHGAVYLCGYRGGDLLYRRENPSFVDINPRSFTMDPEKLEAAITKKTKAILPVHLYGQCADMDPHSGCGEETRAGGHLKMPPRRMARNIKVRKPAPLAIWAVFSFYPGKNLGAYGEGGMVTTNNPDFTRTIRMLRDWGAEKKYQHVLKGV